MDKDGAESVECRNSNDATCEPCRRILNSSDMQMWIHSEGYRDYINFIKQLNEFAKRNHNLNCRSVITDKCLLKVVTLLDHLSTLVDQIEPFNDDKNQRFCLSFIKPISVMILL